MSVDKSLMNLKLKAEILKRVFGSGRKVYEHDFPLKGYTCTKCSMNFWDWVQEKPEGIFVGSTLCGVIGSEEVAMFHDPSDIIRGDDGGY